MTIRANRRWTVESSTTTTDTGATAVGSALGGGNATVTVLLTRTHRTGPVGCDRVSAVG
jgi:hypothetical protein